jgi:hypothetical protein
MVRLNKPAARVGIHLRDQALQKITRQDLIRVGNDEERLGHDPTQRMIEVARLEAHAVCAAHDTDIVMLRCETVDALLKARVAAVVEYVDTKVRILESNAG